MDMIQDSLIVNGTYDWLNIHHTTDFENYATY